MRSCREKLRTNGPVIFIGRAVPSSLVNGARSMREIVGAPRSQSTCQRCPGPRLYRQNEAKAGKAYREADCAESIETELAVDFTLAFELRIAPRTPR